MENEIIIEKLIKFGLTRQEAIIYINLYMNGTMNGYEMSKLTGISRSNCYSALANLAEKGASNIIEGEVKKYVAVPIIEFCKGRINMLIEEEKYLEKNLPDMKEDLDGYITIKGNTNIVNKIKSLLEAVEYRIYLSMSERNINFIINDLKILINKGIKVVVITNYPLVLEGAIIYEDELIDEEIRIIIDSQKVLTGDLSQRTDDTCLYTGQKNFISVFKSAFKNEIKLIEIMRGEKEK